MTPARKFFRSLFDFSPSSDLLETTSTVAMILTSGTLAFKTVVSFCVCDYAFFFAMGVLYFLLEENYHFVPQHQTPVKKKDLNEKRVLLKNSEVQKQKALPKKNNNNVSLESRKEQKREDLSRTVPRRPEEAPKMLKFQTNHYALEYTSGYHEVHKYFEKEEDAVCEKNVHVACALMDRGFDFDRSIEAAKNCDNLETAIAYLMQKCDSCQKYFSLSEIVAMFMCTHKFCKSCTTSHFAKVTKEGDILKYTCQICGLPKLVDEDEAMQYFTNLDRYLEPALPSAMFQKFVQEFKSGTWKTKLKSKETTQSNQYGMSGGWQTVKARGKPPVQNTGVTTRSATRAANSGSTANVATTQLYKATADTTADYNKIWPPLGTGFNKNPLDQSRVENNNNPFNKKCSFCSKDCYVVYKMISCEHQLCLDCTSSCFSQKIRSDDITDWVCPECGEPKSFQSKEDFFRYFSEFRMKIGYILSSDVQTLFERKYKQHTETVYGLCDEEPAPNSSSAVCSRNSVYDYVEQRQTTCPNCGVHCDLTRQASEFVKCVNCKTTFCGSCKAWYNNECERNCFLPLSFHLHHKDICYCKKKKIGLEKLESILKSNDVDFVDIESKSHSCLLREQYNCPNKPFKSDLCRYHYEDYLANLILQNHLKKQSK